MSFVEYLCDKLAQCVNETPLQSDAMKGLVYNIVVLGMIPFIRRMEVEYEQERRENTRFNNE